MNEDPTPQAPEDAPVPVADATPPAEPMETTPSASEEPSCEMPKWFAKLQAVIPGKIAPAKLSPRVARKAALWIAMIIGLLSVAQAPGGLFLYTASLVSVWFSLVAIKRTNPISKQLAVAIVAVGIVGITNTVSLFMASRAESKAEAVKSRMEASINAANTFNPEEAAN